MISPENPIKTQNIDLLRTLFALFVFFLPLVFGSVHYPVLISEYIIGLILIILYLYYRHNFELIKPSLIFAVFILITAIITIVQLIPLPLGVIRLISPKEYELLSAINGVYNNIISPIRFYTLSIEPYINLEYLLRIIVLFFVFLIASQREFTESMILLKAIALSAAIIVLYGFIEGLLNFSTFFSYNIHLTNEGILPSVFKNTNHQAGFLGIAAFSSMALYYSVHYRYEKIFYLFCSILSAIGVFITLSRGGIVAFVASLIFLVSLMNRDRFNIKRSYLLYAGIIIAISTAFYLAYQEIISELSTLTDAERMQNEKYRLVLNSLGLFKDFLIVGVGKGGFETIFNVYREDNSFVSFSQMENQLFQQLADYGVLYFVIVLVVIIWFAYLFLKYPLSTKTALLVTGIFYILLQNLVDFNLEIFSIQTTTLIVLASIIARYCFVENESGEPVFAVYSINLVKKRLLAISIVLLVIFALGIYLTYDNLREKKEAEIELMLMSGVSPDNDYFKDKIRKYPFNYFIPASIAARDYLNTTDPIIKSYLLHSSLINPLAFEPHYMLYRYFFKLQDYANAQSQCRLAIKNSRDNKARLIFSELMKSVDKRELFKYIPYTPEVFTSFSNYLLSLNESELAKEFIEDALYMSENNTDVLRSAFLIYISLKSIPDAEKIIAKYEKIKNDYSLYLLKGILYETEGQLEEAFKQYRIADESNPLNSEILLRIANVSVKMNNLEEARSYFIKTFLCDNIGTDLKIQIYRSIASTYLIQKNTYEALKYLRIALSMRPTDVWIKSEIASICERNGNLHCALSEYTGIAIINPEFPDIAGKIKRIEDRLKVLEEDKRIEDLKR